MHSKPKFLRQIFLDVTSLHWQAGPTKEQSGSQNNGHSCSWTAVCIAQRIEWRLSCLVSRQTKGQSDLSRSLALSEADSFLPAPKIQALSQHTFHLFKSVTSSFVVQKGPSRGHPERVRDINNSESSFAQEQSKILLERRTKQIDLNSQTHRQINLPELGKISLYCMQSFKQNYANYKPCLCVWVAFLRIRFNVNFLFNVSIFVAASFCLGPSVGHPDKHLMDCRSIVSDRSCTICNRNERNNLNSQTCRKTAGVGKKCVIAGNSFVWRCLILILKWYKMILYLFGWSTLWGGETDRKPVLPPSQ